MSPALAGRLYTKHRMVCAGYVCECVCVYMAYLVVNYKYVVGRGGSSIFYGGKVETKTCYEVT